jgi:hypothetical protein
VASFYYALGMTEPASAPSTPAVAPVVPTLERNKLGIAALVLVLITLALPIVGFIAFVIGAVAEGAEGDNLGYDIIGAFFLTAAATSVIAPIAIVGVVLGIVSLFRAGKRKLQGILAIVLGVVPSLLILGLPVAIDTFF